MQLILGTAQFGLGYGIAGAGAPVEPTQATEILRFASANGIKMLDTAAAYGDIEARLAALCNELPLSVISKLPPAPALPDTKALIDWFTEQGELSMTRLGGRLKNLLFHRDQDLVGTRGEAVWQGVKRWADTRDLRLGVSCYDPTTALELQHRLGVTLFQLPGNALDQRVVQSGIAKRAEIHLRSPFLQGLLLMDPKVAIQRLPASQIALGRWHEWCRIHRVSGLTAAFAIVKSFAHVKACVLGVERLDQVMQVCTAWEAANAIGAPEISCNDISVIDPRSWKIAS